MGRAFFMRGFAVLSVSLILVSSLFASNPGTVDPGANKGLEELVEVSGIKRMTEQIPVLMKMGIAQAQEAKKELTTEELGKLEKIAEEAFSSAKMLSRILEKVGGSLSSEKISALMEKHQSPLFKKMVQLEGENSSPEKIGEMGKFIVDLQTKPLSAKRMELLKRLDRAILGAETNVELMVKTKFAMIRAINQILPEKNRQPEATLKEAESKARDELKKNIEEQVIGTWAFVYQSVPENEMEEYVAFHETELGKLWSKAVSEAISFAMESASKDMGNNIGKVIGEEKKEK